MSNSYFKVTSDSSHVFFFDTSLKDTAEIAWGKAYQLAEAHLLSKPKVRDITPRVFISMWKKPHESGPWDSISIIGENGGYMIALRTDIN